MSTPANGLAKLLGTPELEEFCTRFRDGIQADMRTPFHDGLDRYVDALAAAVANVGRQMWAAMEAARDEMTGAAANGPDRLLREATFAGAAADRLSEILAGDPLAETYPLREALFAAIDGGLAEAEEWPDVIHAGPADRWTAKPEAVVRMRLGARLVHGVKHLVRRPNTRLVPVRDLVRTYALAELPRRVEDALNGVARLHAMALAGIRTQLLVATAVLEAGSGGDAENGAPDEESGDEIDAARRVQAMAQITAERLRDAADRARADWDREAADVGTAFERAVFSGIVAVEEERIEDVRQRTVARREAMLDRWLHYERGLRVSTATEAAALSRIAATLAVAVMAALSLDGDVERLLRRPFSEMSQWLADLADSAAAPGKDTLPRMRGQVAELFRRLGTAGELMPAMQQTAEGMRERLAGIPETLPEDTRLSDAPVEDAPATPRDITLRRAPLAAMFTAACEGVLPRFLDSAIEGTQAELGALETELRRLHQAVDFNITAALRDRDAGAAAESRELVEGVLDRSALQLAELRDHIAPLVTGITDALVERAQKETAEMEAAVVDREFVRMRSGLVEEEATRRVTTSMDAAASAAGSVGRLAQRSWTAGRGAVERSRAWTRERLGVARIEREAILESLDRSRLDDETGVQLPPIYQQLFAMDGVEGQWDELLVPREDELAIVQRAFTRWERQHAASVAIFGEKGSGKTTLVRMARQQVFTDYPIVTTLMGSTVRGPADLARQLATLFELDDLDDLDDVADAISAGEPVVAVLEDAHHLFERTLGGFDVMFDFLELLSRTRHKVFWVLTMDGYAWDYLDRVLGIGQHFAFQVNTTTLEADKLERAIMARHDVSGYALRFVGEDAEEEKRPWRPFRPRRQQGRLSRREEARRAFFQELNDIAEGNIFQGMFHWLRAITSVEEYTLVLQPPRMMGMEFLDQMPLFDLHTIAAVVLHGGLTAEQHARVFQMNPDASALHLAALADANMLFRLDDAYKINKVLYRPLVRQLRRRNIL